MNNNINKTTLSTPGTGVDLLAMAIAFFELDIAVEKAREKNKRLEA